MICKFTVPVKAIMAVEQVQLTGNDGDFSFQYLFPLETRNEPR